MGKSNHQQKKKNKAVYIDDGSTIANMSALGKFSTPRLSASGSRASLREQFQTYMDAVRMMFFPMLVVLGILALAFLIVYILL